MKRIVFVCFVAGICILNACSKDDGGTTTPIPTTVDCGTVSKAFAANVNPIIQGNCTGSSCHGSGSSNGPGDLLTYAKINGAKAAIRSAVSGGSMPKGSSLSTTQKNTIICWIDAGAPNN
jgi:hypothetical protein